MFDFLGGILDRIGNFLSPTGDDFSEDDLEGDFDVTGASEEPEELSNPDDWDDDDDTKTEYSDIEHWQGEAPPEDDELLDNVEYVEENLLTTIQDIYTHTLDTVPEARRSFDTLEDVSTYIFSANNPDIFQVAFHGDEYWVFVVYE